MREQAANQITEGVADLARGETAAELASRVWLYTRLLDDTTEAETRSLLMHWLDAVRSEIRIRERMSDPLRPLYREAARFDLERIKTDIPVTEAVSRLASVDLTKRGGNYVGRCPFPDHDDSDPSFHVRADGLLWHCRGCGRGGDLFSFAQAWYGAPSFVGAVDIVVTGMGRSLAAYRIEQPPRHDGTHIRVA